ncbi:MAG: metal ABC transporter ATP-binding protein [Acetobacteraceae bacterium]|nr:metal ABC transporter ATP-binding protein [Acetobacteraceae bacterium]
MTPPPAICVAGLSCRFGTARAVEGLTGRFAPGSLTAVVGPNGAGKTTLLRSLAGLHPGHAGHIDRGGLAARRIALLPQASTLDRSFPVTAGEVVALGGWGEMGVFAAAPAGLAGRVEAALAQVGLAGFAGRGIGALSAGQFQRVMFARLILQDAPVLLLDEPTAAVDARTEADLVALIRAWHAEGRTIIVVLHDLDLVRALCPDTLLLAGEAVAWGPTEQVLTAGNRLRARLLAEAHGAPQRRAA